MKKKAVLRKRVSSKAIAMKKIKARLAISERPDWARIIFELTVNTSLISGIIFLARIMPTMDNWLVYAKGIMAASAITYLRSNFFVSKARVGLFTTAEMFLFATLWIKFAHII